MPVMNGIEAAVEIKKLIPSAHLLMLTSYATATIEGAARSAGTEAFVEKGDPHTVPASPWSNCWRS
ncbi:MAG: hypothetical protein ACRD8A_01550 [Candidatus Acidiferrales bacterium]